MTTTLLAALLIGQSFSTPSIDSANGARVQKTRAEIPAVEIVQNRAPRPSLWTGTTTAPAYARPGYPLPHFEFLQQVTPEAFRASTLYPGAKLFLRSDPEKRRHHEADARKEVHRALQDLTRARGSK